MQNTTRTILLKSLTPGLIPRIKDLFGSGFGFLAYLIAIIFNAVRMLPDNHPYLQPQNYGHFGIIKVLSAASDNLSFHRKNLDQIVIYFAVLAGMVMFVMQVALVVVALFNTPVLAQDSNPGNSVPFAKMFSNPVTIAGENLGRGPSQDLAFILMDRVFGVEGIFKSCISDTSATCEDTNGNSISATQGAFPFPMHHALHAMFSFYSYGILFVSFFVLLYFVVTIVGETAVTGSPFGQRFNKAFGPIRLIVFFALIVPLNNGLNSAQYLTLYTAKYGANFATNGWVLFANTLQDRRSNAQMIARPNIPEIGQVLRFMDVALTCRTIEVDSYKKSDEAQHDAYVVTINEGRETVYRKLSSMGFRQAHEFSRFGDIMINFGYPDPQNNNQINPSCGILRMPVGGMANDGARPIQDAYYNLIGTIYYDDDMRDAAKCRLSPNSFPDIDVTGIDCDINDLEFAHNKNEEYTNLLHESIHQAIAEGQLNREFIIPETLKEKGFGGAGIWYNTIAEANGEVVEAALAIPQRFEFPSALRATAEAAQAEQEDPSESDRLSTSSNQTQRGLERQTANTLGKTYLLWDDIVNQVQASDNAFIRTINMILGTEGLYSLLENQDVNPLAQLSALGKSMIEATVRNVTIAIAGKGLNLIFDGFIGASAEAVSGFIFSIATISLLIGFVMFYIVPFLPFIYFFFALSAWVKSIFEAMVAMPLWAMAHITRFDGEGLPGPAAANGYYLLLEIFLRPFLMIIGFLAAILTFSATIIILNNIFLEVVANVGGGLNRQPEGTFDQWDLEYYRGPVDQFVYTAMYAVIVYLLALQSFKLIDMVPKSILRWIGQSVSALQDDAGDPAGQIIGPVYSSSNIALRQLTGALTGKNPSGSDIAAQAALQGGGT